MTRCDSSFFFVTKLAIIFRARGVHICDNFFSFYLQLIFYQNKSQNWAWQNKKQIEEKMYPSKPQIVEKA